MQQTATSGEIICYAVAGRGTKVPRSVGFQPEYPTSAEGQVETDGNEVVYGSGDLMRSKVWRNDVQFCIRISSSILQTPNANYSRRQSLYRSRREARGSCRILPSCQERDTLVRIPELYRSRRRFPIHNL